MNYLLFVYHNEDIKNTDETTAKIGVEISKIMSSNQIKYMFGDKHSIYHFASDFSIEEIDDFLCLVSDEFENFNYFLTQKTKNVKSNFDQENLLHLLTLNKTIKKKHTPTPPKLKTKNLDNGEIFMDLADIIFNLKRPDVCNLTMDELLDKISDQGINSLTKEEKNKLDEYSKNH
jgi:serine/threonine protein phosphatase PrpC